jgi:signal transduction histidine kinase
VHPIERLGWSVCADPMTPEKRRSLVEVLEGVREGLRESGDQRLLCHVQMCLGVHETFRGDVNAARPLLDEALALADPDIDRTQFLSVLQIEGTYWLHVGQPARAVEACLTMVRESDVEGSLVSFRIKSRLNLCYALACLGEFQAGRDYWTEATEIAQTTGVARRLGEASAVGLILLVDQGDLDAARTEWDRSTPLRTADIDARASALFTMAEAALALDSGDCDRAETLARSLLDNELAGTADDRIFLYTVLAQAALAGGTPTEALAWTDLADAKIPRASHGPRVARVATTRARTFHALGRIDDMFAQFESARRAWSAGSGTLLWQTLKTRLNEIHQLKEVELRATNDALRRLHKEEAKAREQAEAAAKARHLFLSSMSHEMRTPLNGVMGALTLLDHSLPAEEHKRLLGVARRSAHLTLQIIDDILDLGRLESGRMSLNPDTFNLRQTLRDILAMTEKQAEKSKVHVDLRLASDLPQWVRGDERRLKQVLLNLLSNALKFAAGGHVWIRTTIGASGVRFEVEDDGIGIPQPVQHLLFEPFTQAGPAISREYGGTGLGLAISRAIVEAHGGKIGVQSAPGEGATFWVEVHLETIDGVEEDPLTDPGLIPAGPALQGLYVLLVEDNAVNRQLGTMTLEAMGARVDVAADGVFAVQMVEENPPDVVLMDMHMPRMGGVSATRHIRARGFSGPVVAITAAVLPEDQAAALEAGMDAFTTKPIDPTALLRAIQTALDARKST